MLPKILAAALCLLWLRRQSPVSGKVLYVMCKLREVGYVIVTKKGRQRPFWTLGSMRGFPHILHLSGFIFLI